MHLVGFKAHTAYGHVRKPIGVFANIYAAVTSFGPVQVIIIDVKRKARVVVVKMDLRPGAHGVTSTKIQEADLVPHEAPYLAFDGRSAVRSRVAMEPHAFSKSYQ